MTRSSYPIILTDLHAAPCVVVGGGPIAERKVAALLESGAHVVCISPTLTPQLQCWAARGRLRYIDRTFRVGDLEDTALAIAATNDPHVNREVAQEARRARVLVNVVDDPDAGNFTTAATVRRGDLLLAISTNGASPMVAALIRRMLERMFGEEYAELLALLARLRSGEVGQLPSSARSSIWRRLASRRVLHWLHAGQRDRVQAYVDSVIAKARDEDGDAAIAMDHAVLSQVPSAAGPVSSGIAGRGLVSLVGAGPGDPGLITLNGMQRLQQADAVVYDALINDELLGYAPAYAEPHYVGKQAGASHMPQAAINALLIDLGRQGKRVVRLKGGDPYVFGRGGEEAEALQAAELAWEVVPGISAGIAASAYAGIAITHRGYASSVALVTGHEDPARGTARVDWQGLAPSADTIVIYMGMSNLQEIAERLVAGGRSAATPAAVIQWGTLACQQTIVGTLATIAADVAAAGLGSPAVAVVGDVVRLRDDLRWYDVDPVDDLLPDMSRPPSSHAEGRR